MYYQLFIIMDNKICSSCKLPKSLNEFHKYKNSKDGYTHRCKECVSRKKKLPTDSKICTECKISKGLHEFNIRRSGRLGKSSICKSCFSIKLKNYKIKNKEKYRKYANDYKKKTKASNPLFKLVCNMRCRIYDFLNGRKIQKNNTSFVIIGCTPQELKLHLENQFKPGMSWENYSYEIWHVDHIIPLCSAKNEDEIYKLCHYTNLQPMWAKDNMKKGSKIYL